MIELVKISKFYIENKKSVIGLKDINLQFPTRGFFLITGPSGSGKSTLLNILSLKDICSEGKYYFDGIDVETFGEEETQNFKSKIISLVSQDMSLIPNFTVYENILVATRLAIDKKEEKNVITEVLKKLNILDLKKKKVQNLSGGQNQKVAIARALINNPKVIICDEPTSSLDNKNSLAIANILKDISKEILVIVSSHDLTLFKDVCDNIIEIVDGKLVKQQKVKAEKTDNNLQIRDIIDSNQGKRIFNPFKITKSTTWTFVLSFLSIFITLVLYSASLSFINIGKDNYETPFLYYEKDRYVVTRIDGDEFKQNDFDYFSNLSGYKNVCLQDEILDNKFKFSYQNNNSNSTDAIIRPAKLLDESKINGRLPQSDKEFVSTTKDKPNSLSLTNRVISLTYDEYNSSTIDLTEVGIAQVEEIETGFSIFYVNDKVFEKLYTYYAANYYRNYISSCETNYEDYSLLVRSDVPDDYIYCKNNSLIGNSYSVNIKNTSNKIIKYDGISCKDISEIAPRYSDIDEVSLIISENTYSKILNSKLYQISVFTNNNLESNNLYSVVYPNINVTRPLSGSQLALGYFYIILTLVLGLGLSTVSYLFIKNTYKGELENIKVFELLGYSNYQIKKYTFLKILSPILVVYFLTTTLFLIFRIISKSSNKLISSIFLSDIPVFQIYLIPLLFLLLLLYLLFKFVYVKYQDYYKDNYGRNKD